MNNYVSKNLMDFDSMTPEERKKLVEQSVLNKYKQASDRSGVEAAKDSRDTRNVFADIGSALSSYTYATPQARGMKVEPDLSLYKNIRADGDKAVKEAEDEVETKQKNFLTEDKLGWEDKTRGRQEKDWDSKDALQLKKNDPNSLESKTAQELVKQMFPKKDVSGMSAAQLEPVMDTFEKIYGIDMRRRATNAAQNEWFSTGKVDPEGNLIMINRKSGETKSTKTKIKESLTPAQAKEKKEVNTIAAAGNRKSTKLDEIENLYANTSWNGPISGRIGEALNTLGTGTGSENFDTLNQNVKTMISAYIKETTGSAASEKEMIRLESVMPKPSDNDSVAKTKIKALRKEAQAIVNERREAAGLPAIGSPLDQIQQHNRSQTSTVKISNGTETLEIPVEDLEDAINEGFKEIK